MRVLLYRFVAFLGLFGVGAEQMVGSAIAETTAVRVGVYQNAPKVFINQNGKADGFFPDLLNHIATQEHWTLEYVPCAWNDCLSRLEDGTLDLMLDVAYSRERAERFDFNHEVVLANWSTLYVAPNSGIRSIEDVNEKRIAVVDGAIQYPLFREWALASGVHPTFIKVNSFREVFETIRDDKAEGGLVNRLFGAQYAKEYGVERTYVVMAPSQLHFIIPKNANRFLVDAIDRHLVTLKDDKTSAYQQAITRWIVSWETPKLPSWLKWAGFTLVGGLLIALTFVILLRWKVRRKTADLVRTNATLRSLIRVNEILVRSSEEQALLDNICRAIIDQDEDFVMAWVGFANHDTTQPVKIVAKYCVDDDFLQQTETAWETLLLNGGALETAIRTGIAQVGKEIAVDAVPRSTSPPAALMYRTATVSAFPLIVDHRTVGALCLCDTAPDAAAEDRVGLLSQLADDLAFGIKNIRDTESRLEMSKRLQQSEKMDALGDLAGGIAHDLKNMLFPIISLSRMTLEELPHDSRARIRLQKVVQAGERAQSLTQKIHAFSHLDSGDKERRDFCELLESCLSILRPSLPSAIDLVVTCDSAASPMPINVEEARFQTMLLNLGSNAVDAIGAAPGRIDLSVSKVELEEFLPMNVPVPNLGPYVKLEVSDSGVGMDDATAHRIFEPYFSTKERGKGTGLGMVMVQKFIVEHDGGIAVSSAPNQGTTFEIYLPVAT